MSERPKYSCTDPHGIAQSGQTKGQRLTLTELPVVRKRRAIAFTLIELLVVIAIIAMLVSILLPSLRQAKEQAKNVICLRNQRTVFGGMILYAEDWDGGMMRNHSYHDSTSDPPGAFIWGGGDHVTPWSNKLTIFPKEMLEDHPDFGYPTVDPYRYTRAERSYIESPEVYHCPSADRQEDILDWDRKAYGPGTITGLTMDTLPWWYEIQGAYGMNNRMYCWQWRNLWDIAQPAECYLFTDSFLYAFDHVDAGDLWFQFRHGTKRHLLNIMYHDGHTVPEADVVEARMLRYSVGPPWWGGTRD